MTERRSRTFDLKATCALFAVLVPETYIAIRGRRAEHNSM
jgi:hypothetical protein